VQRILRIAPTSNGMKYHIRLWIIFHVCRAEQMKKRMVNKMAAPKEGV
jgi:hypothetical protein